MTRSRRGSGGPGPRNRGRNAPGGDAPGRNAPSGRALGVDLGSRRIGVALSDSHGTVATPYETAQRSGDRGRDHRRLADLVAEAEARVVVVGLPLSLDGTVGPAAQGVLDEVAELRTALPVEVVTWDERLSTVEAERSLRTMNVRRGDRRRVVDRLAATVILQSWLDAGQPRG
ncbi:MAG TPA: Holliday junction resolvase RuvX [Acidimicrobiales bacterium]